MPLVRTNTIYLKSEGGKTVCFKQETTFSVRLKKFSIKLPEWWVKTLGSNIVVGGTLDEVDREWDKAQDKFEQLSQHKRKVIIYNFLSSAMLFKMKDGSIVVGHEPSNEEGEIEDCILRTKGYGYTERDGALSSFHGEAGTVLQFWFTVAYEVTSTYEPYEVYVTKDGRRICDNRMAKPDDRVKAIAWTLQREKFFTQFEEELTKLIAKMHFFLRSEPAKVTALIDQYKQASALPDLRNKK